MLRTGYNVCAAECNVDDSIFEVLISTEEDNFEQVDS